MLITKVVIFCLEFSHSSYVEYIIKGSYTLKISAYS